MYIDPNSIKTKRTAIRRLFPTKEGWKWSVVCMENHAGVVVSLMQYPPGYIFPRHANIDHHIPKGQCTTLQMGEKETEVIKQACDILIDGWNSDAPQYYPQLKIGSWNVPATQTQ